MAASDARTPLPTVQRGLATVALALAVFMNILHISIANVSIPTIAGDLAVSASRGTWIITSFAVANAIAVPISGWLARRVGEVRLFVVCTLLFVLTSWLCGMSFSFPMLLLCRAAQGAVAGPMIPLSQSLMLACYPSDKRGFANGIWGMTAVVGPVAGPVLGGWITDNINWSWIFFINIPVGVASAWSAWMLLRQRETATARAPIDWVGLLLLIVGVGCLQVMLDQGHDKAWFQSDFIIGLALIAVVTLSFFVAWELTDRHPVVDLRLFRIRNFAVATGVMTFGYMAFFSGVVILPLWLQTEQGYTAQWAGIATASLGVAGIVFSPIVGHLADRIDLRLLVTFGFSVFAVISFINAGYNSQLSFAQVVMPRLFWGIGLACFFIPLITLSLTGVAPEEVASASGLFNFVRLLALGFGTSLSVTIWSRRESMHDHQLTTNLVPSNPAAQSWLGTLHARGADQLQGLAEMAHTVTHQAYMLATNDVFWLSGWIFVVLAGVVWLAERRQQAVH